MFSIFTLAIKFDCLFLTIFQSFHLFVGFIFEKLAPSLNICFKRCFELLFSPFQCIKQPQKCLKRSVFPILHFGRHANGRGYGPPPRPWLCYWYKPSALYRAINSYRKENRLSPNTSGKKDKNSIGQLHF